MVNILIFSSIKSSHPSFFWSILSPTLHMSSKMFSYHQPLTLGTPLSPHFQQTFLHTSKENATIHFHEKIEKNYFFQSYAVATHYYYSFFLQLVMIYKIIVPLIMEGMFSFLFHTSFSLLGEERKKTKGCRSKVSGEYLNFSPPSCLPGLHPYLHYHLISGPQTPAQRHYTYQRLLKWSFSDFLSLEVWHERTKLTTKDHSKFFLSLGNLQKMRFFPPPFDFFFFNIVENFKVIKNNPADRFILHFSC